jgi:hypothetical protein
MITGYVVFITFLSVGITSFLRFKIKYRIFYILHHVVFLAYIITILHTIDVQERKFGNRSQTFKWFSASILFYVCDRTAMYLDHRYYSTISSASAIDTTIASGKGKLIILKVKKPDLFHFSPGQYVYLKVPAIDNLWHPFSIGSGPHAKSLNFYIKVYEESSWSGRLFQLINEQNDTLKNAWDQVSSETHFTNIKIEILGPYGCSLGNRSDYTRALVIGTGTGFVPCMSALEEHTCQCLALDPNKYEEGLKMTKALMGNLENKRSTVKNLMGKEGSITRISEIIYNANKARRQLSVHVAFMFAPAFGLLMLGLTLSWNTLPFQFYGMRDFLVAGTICFQTIFLVSFVRGFRSKNRTALTFLDLMIIVINAVADWYWFTKQLWGKFDFEALVYYSLLGFYMFFRLWNQGLQDAVYNPVKDSNDRRSVTVLYEKFCFVWSCRSAELIAQVYPDILETWEELAHVWGVKKAMAMCEIRIHCTDRDENACQQLVNELQATSLFQEGAIKFGRPSIQDLVETNTLDAMTSPTKTASRTLLAFCGSSALGRKVKELKVMNDIFLLMSGNVLHGMDVMIQTYGPSTTHSQKEPHQSTGHFSGATNDNGVDEKAILKAQHDNDIIHSETLGTESDKEQNHSAADAHQKSKRPRSITMFQVAPNPDDGVSEGSA